MPLSVTGSSTQAYVVGRTVEVPTVTISLDLIALQGALSGWVETQIGTLVEQERARLLKVVRTLNSDVAKTLEEALAASVALDQLKKAGATGTSGG